MIEKLEKSSGAVLGFRMSGKLQDEDYRQFVPVVEEAIQAHGKIRLLAQFHDFHGWDLHALWDDIKFSTKHCTDVAQVADGGGAGSAAGREATGAAALVACPLPVELPTKTASIMMRKAFT